MKKIFKLLVLILLGTTLMGCSFLSTKTTIPNASAPEDFYINKEESKIYIKDIEGAIAYRIYVDDKEYTHIPDSQKNAYNEETNYHYTNFNLFNYSKNITVKVCGIFKDEEKNEYNGPSISQTYTYKGQVNSNELNVIDGYLTWTKLNGIDKYVVEIGSSQEEVNDNRYYVGSDPKNIVIKPVTTGNDFAKSTSFNLYKLTDTITTYYTNGSEIYFKYTNNNVSYHLEIVDGEETKEYDLDVNVYPYIPTSTSFKYRVKAISSNPLTFDSEYTDYVVVNCVEPKISITYTYVNSKATINFKDDNNLSFTGYVKYIKDISKLDEFTSLTLDNNSVYFNDCQKEFSLELNIKPTLKNTYFTNSTFTFKGYKESNVSFDIPKTKVNGLYELNIKNDSLAATGYKYVCEYLGNTLVKVFEKEQVVKEGVKTNIPLTDFVESNLSSGSYKFSVYRTYSSSAYDILLNTELSKSTTYKILKEPTFNSIKLASVYCVNDSLYKTAKKITYVFYSDTIDGLNAKISSLSYDKSLEQTSQDFYFSLPNDFVSSLNEEHLYVGLMSSSTDTLTLNSKVVTFEISKPATPILSISNDHVLKFKKDELLYMNNSLVSKDSYIEDGDYYTYTPTITFNLTYTFYTKKNITDSKVYSDAISNKIDLYKYKTPILTLDGDNITFADPSYVNAKYILLINGTNEIELLSPIIDYKALASSINENHTLKVKVVPKDNVALYIDSEYTNEYTINLITDISNIKVSNTNKQIIWDDKNSSYKLTYDGTSNVINTPYVDMTYDIGENTISVVPVSTLDNYSFNIYVGNTPATYTFTCIGIKDVKADKNLFKFDKDNESGVTLSYFDKGNLSTSELKYSDLGNVSEYDPVTDINYLYNRSKVYYMVRVKSKITTLDSQLDNEDKFLYKEATLSFDISKLVNPRFDNSLSLASQKEILIDSSTTTDSFKRTINYSFESLNYYYYYNEKSINVNDPKYSLFKYVFKASNMSDIYVPIYESSFNVECGKKYDIYSYIKADTFVVETMPTYYISSDTSSTHEEIYVLGVPTDFTYTYKFTNQGSIYNYRTYVYVNNSSFTAPSNIFGTGSLSYGFTIEGFGYKNGVLTSLDVASTTISSTSSVFIENTPNTTTKVPKVEKIKITIYTFYKDSSNVTHVSDKVYKYLELPNYNFNEKFGE